MELGRWNELYWNQPIKKKTRNINTENWNWNCNVNELLKFYENEWLSTSI